MCAWTTVSYLSQHSHRNVREENSELTEQGWGDTNDVSSIVPENFDLCLDLAWACLWATPKPNHNKPSHPRVLSWAIFLSGGISEKFRARSLQPLVLKCRMGVQGSIPRTTREVKLPQNLASDRPALI